MILFKIYNSNSNLKNKGHPSYFRINRKIRDTSNYLSKKKLKDNSCQIN